MWVWDKVGVALSFWQERKAAGSYFLSLCDDDPAQERPSHFVALVHNLLLLLQDGHRQPGVENTAEIQRRQKRLEPPENQLEKTGQTLPLVHTLPQRFTQATFKLSRWRRAHSHHPTSLPHAVLQRLSLDAKL